MTGLVVTGLPAQWLVGAVIVVFFALWLWLSVVFVTMVDRYLVSPLLAKRLAAHRRRCEDA